MPSRITPQSAIRAHYRGRPTDIPGGRGDAALIVKARNRNHDHHAEKRFIVTYIYLLMIKHLIATGKLAVGPVERVPMTLQAKGGSNGNQGAHQVLGELTVGGRHLYQLEDLTLAELRTIAYCNSAVSDIPKAYNFVDNLLEAEGREKYKKLASAMVQADPPMPNTQIWDDLMKIFADACSASRGVSEINIAAGQRDSFPIMQGILVAHTSRLLSLNARRDKLTRVGIDKFMLKIETGGF